MLTNITIRKKTLAIVSTGIVCLIAAVYLISRMIVLQGFVELEEKSVRTNLSWVQEAITDKMKHLDMVLCDWSSWDDTYSFIENRNGTYIKSNLIDQTLSTLKINFMIFLNRRSEIVYSMGFDFQHNEKIPVPEDLNKYLVPKSILLTHEDINRSISGILMLNNGPLLVASRPILTSNDQGPARGCLIFGKYLDSKEISQMSSSLYVSLDMRKFDDISLPADYKKAHDDFISGGSMVIQLLNDQEIAGYSVIKDLFGTPCLIMRITGPRGIYHYGIKTLTYFLSALVLFGFIFGVIIFFPLEKEILQHNEKEKKLTEAIKQAEIASQAKSRFLANMSHEIRNPLNSIIGFSTLLERIQLTDQQKDYADGITRCSKMLLYLINDILDISKIEAGEIKLEDIDFDLFYLIKNVIIVNSVRVKEKNIRLYLRVDESMPRYFKGDPTRIRQVLTNFLGNAVKFTEKGEIVVSAALMEQKPQTRNKLKRIRISVKDTGIGIPHDQKDNLFKPFEQTDSSITRKYGGTGLGLAISKALVEMMGGTIGADSEPGSGSEFFFILDIEECPPVKDQDIQPLKLELLKGMRIMIIDNNETSRMRFESWCHEISMNVVHASSSAEEALNWLSSQTELPEVILTEIKMQDMDGYELIKKIRENKKTRGIKVAAITGDLMPGAARQAREAGFNAFLSKPVQKNEFILILQTLLGDRRKEGPGKQILTRHMAKELACKGIKLLIVEDDPENRNVVSTYLDLLGCVTDTASNGKEAVKKVQSKSYDLVLMDIQMPIMNGYEAAQIIRSEISETLPIIALSGSATTQDRDKCLAAGINDYVIKPFEMDVLKEKIIQWGRSG
ncbi:MAG: response regulator [Candidatus Aureabacteria bacterium]|nr:response regulator [Candidatus Auribacterota bacterium]